MPLKFEILAQGETYTESDFKLDLTRMLAAFLRKSLQGAPEAREITLEKLYAFIRMANSQGRCYQSSLQENIHWLLDKRKSLRRIQRVLVGLLDNPDDEIRLFALDGMLTIISEYLRHDMLVKTENSSVAPVVKECMEYYLMYFEENIDIHHSKNKSLSNIHTLFAAFLQQPNPKIRLFSSQVIFKSVSESYLITHVFQEDKYPLTEIQALFLPLLLEQLSGQNLEIRKWAACSLCYFDIAGLVDPQLVASYAEQVLESNNVYWKSRSILALTRLPYNHQCTLSQAAVSRVVDLCLEPGLLDFWDINEALFLLNFQVQYSRSPLPLEIIEKCLRFPDMVDADKSDKLLVSESLLELIIINFQKHEDASSNTPGHSDGVSSVFFRDSLIERYTIFASIESSEGLRFLKPFFEMVYQFISAQKSLQPVQNLLITLLDHSKEGVRLFALQALVLMGFTCYRMEKLSDMRDICLPALIKSMDDPNLTLRNWAACCLCFLANHTFPDLASLPEYTHQLLEVAGASWTKYIVVALLSNLEVRDWAKPVHRKHLEEILLIPLAGASEEDKTSIQKQRMQLVRSHYARHKDYLTAPIQDFVLQQLQVPELKTMAISTCFIFLVKVQVTIFGGRITLSTMLDAVFQSLIQSDSKISFFDTRFTLLSSLIPVRFENSAENVATELAKIFHYTISINQFEDSLKLLLLLFEAEKFLQEREDEYDECWPVFISRFPKIIDLHCSESRSLSGIHNLLMTLSRNRHPEIRLLATQAILMAVYDSYCVRYCDEKKNYPLADLQELFLPRLLQLMNDPDMEVRQFAACSLCFLDIGDQVDPQLLMYYAAGLLNSDSPAAWQTRSILALSRPVYHYPCFLSEEAVSRIVHLCFRSGLLSASVYRYRFRIETFNLLNFQVQYTGIPLPLETIEQCLEYDREGRISPSGRTLVAGSLLRLIGKNFEDQEALKTIPHTISEAVLSCFDNAELRKLAFNNYCLLIQAAGEQLKEILFDKLFCKMRSVARHHNPETHDFVQAILNRVSWSRKEKNEILSILGTAESPEELQAETSFPDTPTDEKDLPTLLAELNALNGNNPNVMALLASHDLETTLAAVKAVYAEDSSYLPAGRPIAEWEVGHCQAWAQAVIQDKPRARSKDFQNEMVAVVMRAGVLDSGQTPRNIQLISLLLLLKAEDRGCLAEVKTGEGKTKIVSMFAAIKVLQVDFVDVVSSSTVLAKRDAHELQNFYSILKMTVADNIDGHSHDGKAPRSCYLANVVYGDTNEYQWDLVRQAIGDSITRGDRPFRILFFDEVDSLLVDRSEHAAMILKPHPGLEYVNHLMVALWHMMVRVGQSISKRDGEWVYQSADGNNQFKIDNPLRFARSLLKKYIVTLIEDPSSSILLPSHLKHFVLTEADELTKAAVDAHYVYHLDKHYVISEGDLDGVPRLTINPIDASLTGEINKNSRWTYLSSFLELRHGLKMGAPQLMSNYMSTPGLCMRYGNQIYGLTGTLGAEDTQALLKDMYQVDLAFIPTYKPRCLIEYEGLLAPGKTDWLANILGRVQEEVNRERPVLVVAATIADVIFLEKEIRKAGFCRKISRFSRNDTDEINTPDQAIEAGEVIVATLIAARGIDWYFAKHQERSIDMRGGMHVIVTTLPLNLRVEQQIFGRTARKGNRGSAELIINRQAIQHQFNEADRGLLDTIQTVKIWRDKVEAGRVHAIRTRSIRLALLKDDLYTRFRGFINTLKNDPMALHRIGGIEEQWAYWLRNVAKKFEHDFNPDTTLPLMEADFEQFIETVRHDPDVIRKNPCRQVQHGNLLNFGTKGIGPDFAAAISAYTRAIQDDPIVGVQAYYNRAEARIFLKEPNYKDNVLSDLHMAKTNLENHIIPQLHSMLVVHNLNPVTTNGFNNDFARQIHCKIELLKLEIANIDQNISIIQQARYQARKAKQKVDFEICELKNLRDFFPDPEARPQKEISELHSSGLSHLFSIQPFFRERKGSGFGALCVAFLGILQIVVGVLVSCAAPMMSSLLIQEGINDIMYTAKALIAGHFDWNAYLANKIGSVSISVISMGLEVLKNSANLEVAAEAAKGQNALKNLAARQLNHEQILEMAKKEVVKRVIDTGVREVFNFAVDKLTTVAMDQFSGDIEDAVGKRLERNLGTTECQSALHAMLQLDVNNQNAAMQGQLDRMASKVMQDRSTLPHTIANHIIKGVLANQHKHVGTFLRIADMGMALDKILQLADSFTRKFRAELLFFHHQNIAKMPQASSVDYQATTPLKNQFFTRITQRLTQCIIAIAKGQIIHPGIDMAMHEHLQNIADLVQQQAIQPAPPEYFAAATTTQHHEQAETPGAAPAGFAGYVREQRDSVRQATLAAAFGKTLTASTPHQTVSVPKKKQSFRNPEQANPVVLTTTEKTGTIESKSLISRPVRNETPLPSVLPEDIDTAERQMWRKVFRIKLPLGSFLSDIYGQFKPHESEAQYILDAMRLYPPMRYVEGAALIGEYSKEHGLAKKAIQTWTTKIKARDPFADDYYRAAGTLVLLEHLATGVNTVKEYTAAHVQERFEQFRLLWKFLMQSAASPGLLHSMVRTVENAHPDERGHASSSMDTHSGDVGAPALPDNIEQIFPVLPGTGRHRFFVHDHSNNRRYEKLPDTAPDPGF
ncbi:preprotein translocase, secretion protein SecA [Legionella geestiana]|uniref:Preprotein translocase, secretion protein SecA n=1 Tax=Legionella geestiana TaxID=45065 RepID=A0A0W0U7M8_9GAMM|nr:hypothetical protein [Legionella geestiana]KTD03702.1 preprotein translocase, secretion protein SecA [Legionella geestiana]QBS11528.1 hypothetical protein E4T54_01550 [Legionella geestiana]STX53804.1 preprotein translocase, secretion protein SecA [Legionella geestiana]